MAPTPAAAPAAPAQDLAAPIAAGPAGASGTPTAGGPPGVRNFGNQRRMISELERINALNLEPSLPKVDDGNRSVSRYSQDRDKVKNEFQQFLTVMKKNDEAKAGNQPTAASSTRKVDAPGNQSSGSQKPNSNSQPSLGSQPMFTVENTGPSAKLLENILTDMLKQASSTNTSNLDPDWPEAKGPSYHEVLGRPTNNNGNKDGGGMPPQGQGGGPDAGSRQGHGQQGNNRQGGPGMGQDQGPQMRPNMPHGMPNQQQQQQQQQQGGPPQGGYVMAPGGPGQGQPQMQMFMPGMQGPGGMQQMQGIPMQGGQPQMMMMPGGGQPQMMAMMGGQPGQQMAVPMGMMQAPQQGGGPNQQGQMMMPQMDGQQQQQMMFMPVMMAPQDGGGQFMPQGMQGFAPPQGGGQGNPQQGAYMMQQPIFHPQGGNNG